MSNLTHFPIATQRKPRETKKPTSRQSPEKTPRTAGTPDAGTPRPNSDRNPNNGQNPAKLQEKLVKLTEKLPEVKKGSEKSEKTSLSTSSSAPSSPTTLTKPQVPAISPSSPQFSLFNIWCVSLALKCLLFIAYHSTDFDVHRNWLAITNKLPLSKWYIENTSQWTLDYPPFFAYFEWALSQLVPQFVAQDGCLDIVEKGNYGLPTVFFQRISVVATEAVLFFALQWYIRTSGPADKSRAFAVASSLILSPGLLIIDHIHFQYNGMMYGILVLMINSARLRKHLLCGFWFSVLLCFKHIYLYLAPAVFIFLLRDYTLSLQYDFKVSFYHNAVRLVRWSNLFKLGAVVVTVFAAAFAPFAYYNVIPQLLSRLFPFSRGLTHAYWAPNIWAVYSFMDRVLIQAYKQLPICRVSLQKLLKFNPHRLEVSRYLSSATRGLVGDVEFLVLPNITPKLTFLLTLFYQVMALIPLFLQPTYERFIGALTLCGYASFLFGWHVHEKAILLVIFPFTFLVTKDKRLLSSFNLLVACGHVSLFPLIFTCEEWTVKVVYSVLWYLLFYFVFRRVVMVPKSSYVSPGVSPGGFFMERISSLYVLGLIPVTFIVTAIDLFEHKYDILKKLEFMKLMIISVYCGVGIIGSWNAFNWLYFVDEIIWDSD